MNFLSKLQAHWPAWRGYILMGLIFAFAILYLSLPRMLPFDMTWDMDMTTVQDALLVNSGRLPLHLDHPKFVMHLLTAGALRLGTCLGWISVANLADLAQSPSPMLCAAELVMYLRSFQACFVWLILLLALGILFCLFPRHKGLLLLAAPVLGLQTSLIYGAVTTRTEIFSVFFLLLGLLLFAWLAQLARRRQSLVYEVWAWLLGGFFTGLALINKVQTLTALPLFLGICAYICLRETGFESRDARQLPRRLTRAAPALLALLLLAWMALAWQAWYLPPLPGGMPNLIPLQDFLNHELSLGALLSHLKLQIFWAALLSSVWIGLLLAGLKPFRPFARLLRFYPLFWLGLLPAFALPLFAYLGSPDGLSKSWTFTLQMAKSCIWTDTNTSSTLKAGSVLPTLEFVLSSERGYLLLLGLALGLLIYLMVLNPAKRAELRLLGLSLGAGLVVLFIGARPILRDSLWFEFLGVLGLLILFNHSWALLQTRNLARTVLGLGLGLFCCSALVNFAASLDQIALYFIPINSSSYGALLTSGFHPPGQEFPEIFRQAYGPNLYAPKQADNNRLRRAVEQARMLTPIRQLADIPFLNRRLPVKALGLAEPHFPIWQSQGHWARFESLAPSLSGSILVNPALLQPQGSFRDWIGMNERAPLSERHIKASGGDALSLLSTWDAPLLFCLSKTDYERLFQILPAEKPALRIVLGEHHEDYYPLRIQGDEKAPINSQITGYTEIKLSWLKQFRYQPFFLIQPGKDWGDDYQRWSYLENMLSD